MREGQPVAQLPAWRRVLARAASDRIALVAAGCAFYAMLALFPALSLSLSLYGLMLDVGTVAPQLAVLGLVLPESVHALLLARVAELAAAPGARLGLGAGLSLLLALWSASAGIRALLNALNIAHGTAEQRHFLAFYATALLLTALAIAAVILGLAFLVVLPSILDLLGLAPWQAALGRAAGLLLLLGAVLLAIATLYRFGPARRPRRWRLVTPGSVLATLLWVLGSAAFSFHLRHLASHDALYGPLGAAVALLMWFYVAVYAILLGAEVDAVSGRTGDDESPDSVAAGARPADAVDGAGYSTPVR